ncbi:histidine phosphatase family protein [Celeribacter neptunius]|uniref:Broad specificity phosphatase PhoE n=1 Tax=Celeribacter neptunius TaxID=588602 RepID=A0A1I3VEC5_9RHOB|nr:histidine phosphatase family protein [Celeribacter neptunius]SFJ93532.1 Broad specificity phosphatase PhoE [Celeribacter neptunius]
MRVFYLSHPQIALDRQVPVPRWGLNHQGRLRLEAALSMSWHRKITRIVSSTESKAMETAAHFAEAKSLPLTAFPELHENDRSATGFLPPEEFEAVADAFFAHPDKSIRGWEPARRAQARVIAAVGQVLDGHETGDVLICGHGGVGTLLMLSLAGKPISRDADQPAGGGNLFAFDPESRALLFGWTPLEEMPPL